MAKQVYYEVDGAVFLDDGGKMQVYSEKTKAFKPYEGDVDRVYRMSNPMSLEEVKPYMAGQDADQAAPAAEKPEDVAETTQ